MFFQNVTFIVYFLIATPKEVLLWQEPIDDSNVDL